jgi:N-acetyl-anhydromuramyl-L-alanine amidase AmpD
VTGKAFSRRRFLWTATGLAAAGLAARRTLAPPTPAPSNPNITEPREYFVALEDYHELPPDCYEPNLIQPLEIIVHWDGNRKGRDLWLAPITYETLSYLLQSSHFAVDYRRVWQMLPMYQTVVQESHGAKGYNWEAINVEMAGIDFDTPENYPPENEIRLTVRLVSLLMNFYGIAFEHIAGHYERDPRGDKKDPGEKFMADFRERLKAYRARLSPAKHRALENP